MLVCQHDLGRFDTKLQAAQCAAPAPLAGPVIRWLQAAHEPAQRRPGRAPAMQATAQIGPRAQTRAFECVGLCGAAGQSCS